MSPGMSLGFSVEPGGDGAGVMGIRGAWGGGCQPWGAVWDVTGLWGTGQMVSARDQPSPTCDAHSSDPTELR